MHLFSETRIKCLERICLFISAVWAGFSLQSFTHLARGLAFRLTMNITVGGLMNIAAVFDSSGFTIPELVLGQIHHQVHHRGLYLPTLIDLRL